MEGFLWFLILTNTVLTVSGEFRLTILHTNDIHSRLEEIDKYGSMCSNSKKLAQKCFGGVARMSTKINEIRSLKENVLMLDGGDQETGTMWYDVWKGNATARILNELHYDAMVLGNHDFDDGAEHVIKYLGLLNASVVMSNVETKDEPLWPKQRLYNNSLVLKLGKENVGICGYVLTKTSSISNPGPNIKFTDEIPAVKACTKRLASAGINKIIVLGHSGIEMDKRIANEVEDVDIVVGGHTNTFLYTGKPPSNDIPYGPYPLVINKKNGKHALVVQAFAFGKYLGYLNVTFDDKGNVKSSHGNPILLDQSVKQDSNILAKLAAMKGPVDKIGKVKIGQTRVFLDGERASCRLRDCALGNLITDAAVYNSALSNNNNSRWTTASIALWTANSIMASIDVNKTGFIRYEDIKNSFPYMNKLDLVELRGSVLLEVLEKSASFYNTKKPSGSFLQVSGLVLTYDMSKAVGKRVTRVEVLCSDCRVPRYEKLLPEKIYKVIVSSYMAKGGAGYEMLRTKRTSHSAGAVIDVQAVVNYIKSRTPLIIETGNRVTIVHSSSRPTSGCCQLRPLFRTNVFFCVLISVILKLFL